jgi:hypothetical protein
LDYLPPPERAKHYEKRAQVLRLFSQRVVVQAESLTDSEAAEPRTLVARIVLRMLCMNESSEQEEAKLLVAQWYSASKSPWTAAFESALRQMVSVLL